MEIREVEEILGLTRFLRLPKHIFITDERVYEDKEGSRNYFRGLQPANIPDVIFLPRDADVTTVPHEVWHSMTGLGEATAYPVGRLIAAKIRAMQMFPAVKERLSRPIKYVETTSSEEFPQAKKYRGRVRHFVLAD